MKRRIQILVECDVKDLKEFEEKLRRVERLPRMVTGLPPIVVIEVTEVPPCSSDPST